MRPSMRRLNWFFFILASVVAVAVVVLAIALVRGMYSNPTNVSPTNLSRSTGSLIEEIKPYPGSTLFREGCENEELQNCSYGILSSHSITEVMTYYKNMLQAEGWTPTTAGGGVKTGTRSLDLVKTNPDGTAPMRRRLLIMPDESSDTGDLKTYVSVWHQLWPDPFRIPVYSGARDTEEKWLLGANNTYPCQDAHYMISYMVTTTSETIRQYYSKTMSVHGWGEDKERVVGQHFSYTFGTIEPIGAWSSVDVTIESDSISSGQVRVKVTGDGNEIDTYCEAHKDRFSDTHFTLDDRTAHQTPIRW